MKAREILRDLFLGGLALAILYDQVLVARTAQPILIFLVIFLFGCIPFLRGDRKEGEYGPFVRIIMSLLGVRLPGNFQEAESGGGAESDAPSQPHGRGGSQKPTQEPRHGSTSVRSSEHCSKDW